MHDIAMIYAGLGDRDHAFEYLTRTLDQGFGGDIMDQPFFPLRSDPRFVALRQRIHLEH